jgi:dihydroorotate dehydrogenase electron transfer subunit
MRYFDAAIIENQQLGGGYFRLSIDGCSALIGSRPGQFVMVRGDWDRDPLLPRAFSLLSVSPTGRASILAKTVGRGTALLEQAPSGTRLSILGPLGTPFPEPSPDYTDLLVGGGVGIPPLYLQAELASARALGPSVDVIYGGRRGQDLVLLDEMRRFGVNLFLATEDGSVGRRGLVTAELSSRLGFHRETGRNTRIMACGPNAMLWAVADIARQHGVPCFVSVEENMACGIGVCLGCAVPAHSRPFRYVCKDGPVFDAADLVIPISPISAVRPASSPAAMDPDE